MIGVFSASHTFGRGDVSVNIGELVAGNDPVIPTIGGREEKDGRGDLRGIVVPFDALRKVAVGRRKRYGGLEEGAVFLRGDGVDDTDGTLTVAGNANARKVETAIKGFSASLMIGSSFRRMR